MNEAIARTLRDTAESSNFYFYNNGITLICDRFDYNALQPENHKVRVDGLQIINGGQTSKTIQSTLAALTAPEHASGLGAAFVLVRLYQVPRDSSSFVQTITYATNSQNPVDLKDLRSNDERQRQLELSVKSLGYEYRRQRSEGTLTAKDITVGAEAVLSVWRRQPQVAKFRVRDHFGKFHDQIFTRDLSGAQLVSAVLLFRIAENKRRRPPPGAPDFVRYAAGFLAMIMGVNLLVDLGVQLDQLDHRTFEQARQLIDTNGEAYFAAAVGSVGRALEKLYGGQPVSLQRLAATFRRGDLLEYLV